MATISMTNKDFTDWYKNYVAEGESVSLWEQALTGLQSAYQPQISAVQQTTSYDISQAYANYKKSQLNLMQSQQLGTGLKEQLTSGLGEKYQSAYQQAKTTEAQQLSSLASSYAEDVASIEEQFTQFGETASQLQKALFEYASSGAGETTPSNINYDFNRAFIPESEGGLELYQQTEDGIYRLTKKGEEFYDKLLNQYITTYDKTTGERVTTGFGDWLLENKEYSDLGKAYAENPALYAEAFGGKNVSDLEVAKEEQSLYKANEAESVFAKKYETYYNKNKEFESDVIRENYYTQLSKDFKILDDWKAGSDGLKSITNDLNNLLGLKAFSGNKTGTQSYIYAETKGSYGNQSISLNINYPEKYLNDKQIEFLKSSGFKYEPPKTSQGIPRLRWNGDDKENLKYLLTNLYDVDFKNIK